jgi:hypothetical protein
VAAQYEHRRCVLDLGGAAERGLQCLGVVGGLAQGLDVPSVTLEAASHVVGVGELGGAVDGDVVVVVHVDEAAQLEVSGQGGRLVADALHEVAVAADHVGPVVAQVGTEARPQPALGDAEPHGVGEPLPERPGGELDPRRVVHLGVAGCLRAPLAEGPEVVERQPVTGEVEHRIQQDRRVPRRQDEPVAVGPVGGLGVVAHDAGPQDVGQGRQGHGRAGMTAVGGLGGVHGQAPDDVDGTLLEGGVGSHLRFTLVGRSDGAVVFRD